MANIKLGALVSDIQGSIGGTTFRRTNNGHSAYNKQKRQFLSANASGSQKIALGNVFQQWSQLSEEVRIVIENQAKLFQFPDKFGNMKNLTGRQLFIKLTSQLLPTGSEVSNWSLLDSYVDAPIISDVIVNLGAGQFDIDFEKQVNVFKILVSAKPKPKPGSVKPHAHFRTMMVANGTSSIGVDFYNKFIENFPLAGVGQTFQVNVYAVNEFGFKSAVSAVSVTIEA